MFNLHLKMSAIIETPCTTVSCKSGAPSLVGVDNLDVHTAIRHPSQIRHRARNDRAKRHPAKRHPT